MFELVSEPEPVYELVLDAALVFELVLDFNEEFASPRGLVGESALEAAPKADVQVGIVSRASRSPVACGSIGLVNATTVLPVMRVAGPGPCAVVAVRGSMNRKLMPVVPTSLGAPVCCGSSRLPFVTGWELLTVRRAVLRPSVVRCVRVVNIRM